MKIRDMREWEGMEADLMLTDPPFGIDFDGEAENYNRDDGPVAEGYEEWATGEYREHIEDLVEVAERNLHEEGSLLVFSGWQKSAEVHDALEKSSLELRGKLYWTYNFAPYCRNRPAHNVYEIFWATQGDEWQYENSCSHDHCTQGEANLAHIPVKREYRSGKSKYPTQLPGEVVRILVDHFTQEGDLVFDPLAGSGIVGVVAENLGREVALGDINPKAREVYETMREEYHLSADDALEGDW